jgi:phosphoribosylanthranilate isomerase
MRVKICGITRKEDAQSAENYGADAIGVVLFSESPRSISTERAREIFDSVGPFITKVAVTHTKSREDLNRILALHPDAIQISHPFVFDEKPAARVIRVMGHSVPPRYDCDAIIVDESHGKGKIFDLASARDIAGKSKVPVILAGGLTPLNVGEAIREIQPYAVDVASGVELSKGIKDHEKIRMFIAACRRD